VKAERAALMPDWPARMGEDMAALYLGISPAHLREGYQHGRYPHPIHDGRRIFWARKQLDDFVAVQFGLHETVRKNTWD